MAASPDNHADCTKIEIPSGNHSLTSQTFFPAEINKLEITGVGQGVWLICDYILGSSNYTWYFAGLQSVSLTGMRFEGCRRPLRLDTVAEVVIHDCSFRYIHVLMMNILCTLQ